MAAPQQPVIIIRRKKRGGHAGHHGGAWKVAYADFVTAMMSFFLLLWLLNVTTDVERKGIADYFAPASISKSESGAGGVMGGQTITVNGAQMSAGSPPSPDDRTIPTVGQGDEGDEDTKGKSDKVGDGGKDQAAPKPPAPPPPDEVSLADAMKKEEAHFKDAETALKQAITGSAEFQDLAQQILIDRTSEGLRIQIVDRDKFSMFPAGGGVPYERGRDLSRFCPTIFPSRAIPTAPPSPSIRAAITGAFQPNARTSAAANWSPQASMINASPASSAWPTANPSCPTIPKTPATAGSALCYSAMRPRRWKQGRGRLRHRPRNPNSVLAPSAEVAPSPCGRG